jgi:serine/threonine protein kinase
MASAISPGFTFGGFVFDKALDSGAFASVWRAHPVSCPDLPVAIKCIAKETISTTIAHTRLSREISLLQRMRHPLISEFFAVMDDPHYYYIAMEYVAHGNMLDFVNNQGRLSEDLARRYFTQIIWVLDYLHCEQRVAHRDIKCENILLDIYDNVRVIDFGLSYQFTDVHPELKTACGSPAYAAPEMIKGNLYTRSADIWSTGVLLYALVVGYLPFDDENVQRTLQKIVYSAPVYPGHLSPALTDLLQKMMCKDPDERYDLDRIKAHPWFSHSEYTTMLQLSQGYIQQWETHEGGAAESAIDPEVIAKMTQLGIDCKDLHEALLTQTDTDLSILYRIFCRQALTENMKDLMQRVAQGHAVTKAKGVPLLTAPKLPPLYSRVPRPGTPIGAVGTRILQQPVSPVRGGRRLSRPVAVRRPETYGTTSYETP